jgi:hypothetical protein
VDHHVRNFNKETSHSLVGVVIAGYCVDHLNRIDKCRELFNDGSWVAFVESLDELFQSLKVLYVVLGFVKLFCDLQLNTSPF